MLAHGRPRTVRVPRLPREQRAVVRWLATREGREWSRRRFTDATECHEIIELVDDCDPSVITDHYTQSDDEIFDYLRWQFPEWNDLTWTPDVSP